MKKLPAPVMRKMLLIAALTVTVSFASAQGIDKTKPITLQARSLTCGALIAEIEKQTGYMVAYDKSVFNDRAIVEAVRTNITLGDALSVMLDGADYAYSIDGKYIILHRRNGIAENSQVVVTAIRTVSGTVTDAETGEVWENVIVEFVDVNGATTKTNVFGRFTIAGIPSGNHIIKLTPPDGGLVRYREIRVPGASDPDVTFSLGGETLMMTDRVERQPSEIRSATKTTAYFVPKAADHTIRAFSEEPKTDYSFMPYQGTNDGYLPKIGVKTGKNG